MRSFTKVMLAVLVLSGAATAQDVGCTSTLKGYPSSMIWGRQLPTAECHIRNLMILGQPFPDMQATIYSLDVCNEQDYFAETRVSIQGQGSTTLTIPKDATIPVGLNLGRYSVDIRATSVPTPDGFSLSITLSACAKGGTCIPLLTETVPFVVDTDGSSSLCGIMNHTLFFIPLPAWIGGFGLLFSFIGWCCCCRRRRRRLNGGYGRLDSTVAVVQASTATVAPHGSLNYGSNVGVHPAVGFQPQQQQQPHYPQQQVEQHYQQQHQYQQQYQQQGTLPPMYSQKQ